MQKAGAPDTFNIDFIKDLGFTSSQDRPTPKLFKYLGFLDSNGHPQGAYREFMDHNKSKQVLAARMRAAFDDLFLADKNANQKTAEHLKGWFKTKTGVGDSVAEKIAKTFKSLAAYADFSAPPLPLPVDSDPTEQESISTEQLSDPTVGTVPPLQRPSSSSGTRAPVGLVYRFEIHLPDTQNVDTFRAIFRALREELM